MLTAVGPLIVAGRIDQWVIISLEELEHPAMVRFGAWQNAPGVADVDCECGRAVIDAPDQGFLSRYVAREVVSGVAQRDEIETFGISRACDHHQDGG